MSIKRGNALKEDARAVLTETRFSKNFEGDLLLLLEGPDDIKVINDYFIYINISKNYRLIKANDEVLDEAYQFAGKKMQRICLKN